MALSPAVRGARTTLKLEQYLASAGQANNAKRENVIFGTLRWLWLTLRKPLNAMPNHTLPHISRHTILRKSFHVLRRGTTNSPDINLRKT
jgi:hypothetical protein